MSHENAGLSMHHISDEDLVRSADGELSPQRAAEVKAHLEACWDCRARMEDFQSTIAEFMRAHDAALEVQLPPASGPRALLRARVNEVASERRKDRRRSVFPFGFGPRVAAVCLLLVATAIAVLWSRRSLPRRFGSASILSDMEVAPNHSLTPGAARQVTMSEVCSAAQEEVVGDVSVSLREKVLQEYGIAHARGGDYEIDYLIAPGLGGTEDIRNLWPEPYRTRVWNAYVKDALEERLHEMVCSGQLDLHTAQHDIATDWIAAYKKYFHTNKPLPLSS